MKLNIAICEDEPLQTEYLKTSVTTWAESSGNLCNIMTFSSSEAFLFEYENNNIFDILFLDVEMSPSGVNKSAPDGIELAKRIRKNDKRAEIIFVTSHFELISEGYEVDALHYLIKPVPYGKLSAVLDKALTMLSREPLSVIINVDGETVKLNERDILYVESFLHYIIIHTVNGEYKIKENLSSFSEKLSDMFFRVHRSYLVSLAYVTRISRTSVILNNKTELPLSRGLYDKINRAFINKN